MSAIAFQMAKAVTWSFCKITHKHVEEILDIARGSLDVAQLTHALQKTVGPPACPQAWLLHGSDHANLCKPLRALR